MKPLTPEIAYSRATVKAWERLRLYYNIIVALAGGALLLRTLQLQNEMGIDPEMAFVGGNRYPIGHPLELVAYSLVFGFVANICYCLGPYLEFVIAALGFPISGQRSRYFVFGIGTMLSLAVIGCGWLYVEFYFITPLVGGP